MELEARRGALWALGSHACARRQERRIGRDEVEAFFCIEHAGVAEVAQALVDPVINIVQGRSAPRQGDADLLHLDADQARLLREEAKGHEPDRTDASTEVEQAQGVRPRPPCHPGGEHVVGGESVPTAQLEDPPPAGEAVQGDVGLGARLHGRSITYAATCVASTSVCDSHRASGLGLQAQYPTSRAEPRAIPGKCK